MAATTQAQPRQSCYGYMRVSTRRQSSEKTLTLDAQAKSIRDTAEHRNWKLLDVVTEIGSAYSGHQRALHRLVERIEADAPAGERQIILVHSFDRFSRHCQRALEWIDQWSERGIFIVSATEDVDYTNASGRLHLSNILAAAEYQSRITGEKVKNAQQILKTQLAQNQKLASSIVPFGWHKQKQTVALNESEKTKTVHVLEIDPHEYGIMRVAHCIRTGASLKEIHTALYQLLPMEQRHPIVFESHTRKRKGSWDTNQVQDGPEPKAISFENIADLLNDYLLFRRGQRWDAEKLRRAMKRYDPTKSVEGQQLISKPSVAVAVQEAPKSEPTPSKSIDLDSLQLTVSTLDELLTRFEALMSRTTNESPKVLKGGDTEEGETRVKRRRILVTEDTPESTPMPSNFI
jgi:DNA invertase Pin-like site-specific DNA recombinase